MNAKQSDNLTVSLETATKLKAAGYPQRPYKQHMYIDGQLADVQEQEKFMAELDASLYATRHEWIAAPTAYEIGCLIPPGFHMAVDDHGCIVWTDAKERAEGDTWAEALAALWLVIHSGVAK